jgi:hypothetical protein
MIMNNSVLNKTTEKKQDNFNLGDIDHTLMNLLGEIAKPVVNREKVVTKGRKKKGKNVL